MPQALWAALREDGHEVIRPEDLQIPTPMSAEDMTRFARLAAPDVILCLFLKEVVPAAVCQRTTTWIPHLGIRGDRGPSSLSWAILDGQSAEVGADRVSGAEPASSAEELDGGNVGAWRSSPCRPRPPWARSTLNTSSRRRSSARERSWPGWPSTRRTAACPWPTSVAATGRHRPALRQDRLAFAWDDHPDQILLRRVRAAPFGVRTELGGQPVNVYDAHLHDVTGARSRAPGPGWTAWPDRGPPRRRRAGRDRRGRRGVDRPRQGQAGRRRPGRSSLPSTPSRPTSPASPRASCTPTARSTTTGPTRSSVTAARAGWAGSTPSRTTAPPRRCSATGCWTRCATPPTRTPAPSP